MRRNTRGFLLTLAVVSLIGASAGGQTPANEVLNWGIVGSSSCATKPCYDTIMGNPTVQRVLLDLANAPREKSTVDSNLKKSGVTPADLLRFELIKERGDQYVVNFPLFTAGDMRKILSVTDGYAASLAGAILAHRQEIEAELRTYDAPGVDRREVAFFVLGCASLDWDGLTITAEKGYRRKGTPKPDGVYVPDAEEKTELSGEKIYKGSHHNIMGGIDFTSFGDDAGRPRLMLPDLAYGLVASKNYPSDFQPALKAFLDVSRDRTTTVMGRVVLTLHDGEMSNEALAQKLAWSVNDVDQVLRVLLAINYVREDGGRYQLAIPVLTKGDEAMTRRLLAIGHEVMVAWFAANYDNLKGDLRDLNFVRASVPYEDGFTMIWHFVFGKANQKLVEAGLFADPYKHKIPGAIAAVSSLDMDYIPPETRRPSAH